MAERVVCKEMVGGDGGGVQEVARRICQNSPMACNGWRGRRLEGEEEEEEKDRGGNSVSFLFFRILSGWVESMQAE